MACNSKRARTLLLVWLIWAYPAGLLAVSPPLPDQPAQYVVDLGGVLDAGARARLNGLLKDLEAKTTSQVVVLTVNSLEGEPIESFSHQTAVKWGLGQKGKDNGVLLIVAVKDRKYRLEVGYGLEAVLPDSLVGSLGRQFLVPNFRRGDFAGGIVAAVTEIAAIVSGGKAGGPGAEGAPPAQGEAVAQKDRAGSSQLTLVLLIIFIILMLGVIALSLPRLWSRRRDGSSGGGFWVGGSGGGWSSGGGFSGGGGDFGGGGASGDW